METKNGIVYILTNPAMPNLIKIGYTANEDVKTRMAQIYTSGVPLPFECVYAARVNNHEKVEKALHIAFGPDRINPRREFFEIDASQAIAIIRLLEIEDVTPKVASEQEVVDEIEREAGKAYATKKRPRFNFSEMNIPIGSLLVSVANGETVSVKNNRYVEFRNEEKSLTYATKIILNNDYSVAPGSYWTYNGRKLCDIYDETYGNE